MCRLSSYLAHAGHSPTEAVSNHLSSIDYVAERTNDGKMAAPSVHLSLGAYFLKQHWKRGLKTDFVVATSVPRADPRAHK